MKFEDIPYDVQLIAAKCLAHKLTSYGFLAKQPKTFPQ
jgi:hypothetical protein